MVPSKQKHWFPALLRAGSFKKARGLLPFWERNIFSLVAPFREKKPCPRQDPLDRVFFQLNTGCQLFRCAAIDLFSRFPFLSARASRFCVPFTSRWIPHRFKAEELWNLQCACPSFAKGPRPFALTCNKFRLAIDIERWPQNLREHPRRCWAECPTTGSESAPKRAFFWSAIFRGSPCRTWMLTGISDRLPCRWRKIWLFFFVSE